MKEGIEKYIKERITDVSGTQKEIDSAANIQQEFGLDSLDFVELTMSCEKKYNVTFNDQEVLNVFTVNEIVELIMSKSPRE